MKRKQPHTSRLLFLTMILLVIILLLTSCIENVSNTPTGKGQDETEEAYFSLNLDTYAATATSRAEIEEIEPREYRVNQVWILLYNQSDILEYKYILNIQNYNSGNTALQNFYNKDTEDILENKSGTTNFQTVAKPIKKKTYKMAVLANPPATLLTTLNIETGSPLSNLTQALDGRNRELNTKMFGGYQTDPSLFFMSNANGLIPISPATLQPTIEAAQATPVQINLDRLLAKVAVKEHKNGIQIYPNGTLLDNKRPIKWYLDATNKSTYLIRKFAPLADGTQENEANSPKGAGRKDIYAEDPNFTLGQNTSNQFHVWQASDQIPYSTWISDNHSDPTATTYQYAFENTMDVQTQSNTNAGNYTTRIVLEAHLIYPQLLWDPNDPNNESDPNRNYYSCLLTNNANQTNWRIFTHQQAAHWLNTGFPYLPTPGNETENAWIKLLEETIKKVQTDSNNNTPGAFNFQSSQLPGTNKELYRTYNNITYHPMGLNKYNIPIRHFGNKNNSTNPVENYGYYGVVRNNMYTLTVNSITGPGVGIYDWDSRYISTEITITPWYKRKQQVDLGYE